jgi:hypothetical protein
MFPGGITMRTSLHRLNRLTRLNRAESAADTERDSRNAERRSTEAERDSADAGREDGPRTPAEAIEQVVEGVHRTPDHPVGRGDPGQRWERHVPDDEKEFGRIRGFQRQGGGLAPTTSHRGRLPSWVAVALGIVGFAAGGLGVALGSVVLLVVAAVLLVAALVVAIVFDMSSDVVLDPPRVESEERHDTPLHRIKKNLS